MADQGSNPASPGLLSRLRRRGVIRVAASYAVIAWLLLQIGDVVLEPLGLGEGAMQFLIILLALGFPVALLLAWFLEITPQGIEVDRAGPATERPQLTGVRRYADLAIIGGLLIVVAWLVADRGGLIEEAPRQEVVAVLPFANLSAEAEDAYFGEGLADTLIHKLGQLNELVVLASQSTFQFSSRDLDLEQVGAKLGATVILLGTVQRSQQALRINARLVDVGSGRQLWSGSYDRSIEDVFAIQDEIAGAATAAMHVILAPEDRARLTAASTRNLTAYDAYVLGVNRLARRTRDDRDAALTYFEQAIAADPGFSLAHTGLVEGLYLHAHSGFRDEDAASIYARSDEAARQALALDPSLGEAWLARALAEVVARDIVGQATVSDDDIIGFFQKAVDLSPNNAMAHKYFSNFFYNSLRVNSERSRSLIVKAAELDPRSGIISLNVGGSYIDIGDYETAEQWYRRALRTQEPYFRLAFMQLVELHLLHTGRFDEAARWTRAWRRLDPEDAVGMVFEQDVYLTLDARDDALETLELLRERANSGQEADQRAARWGVLHQGIMTARRLGELEQVDTLSRDFVREILEPNPAWPVLQGMEYVHPVIAAWTLAHIAGGRHNQALERLQAAYPGPEDQMHSQFWEVLQPPVLLGALLKHSGDQESGMALLRSFLDFIRSPDEASRNNGIPRIEFATLAMLGETDAALDALERAVDEGRVYQWWSFREGAFDPDFAAVVAHPRFAALEARIQAQLEEQRNALAAEPELPVEALR